MSAEVTLREGIEKAKELLRSRGIRPPYVVNLHPSWASLVDLKNHGKVLSKSDQVIRMKVSDKVGGPESHITDYMRGAGSVSTVTATRFIESDSQ